MGKTKISWTDMVWNPTRGCSKVSPGCDICYAARYASRFNGPGLPFEGLAEFTKSGAHWSGQVRLLEDRLQLPIGWREPKNIFVDSMSDLFHDEVPDEFIRRVWEVMTFTPQHTYQILTKRSERMSDWFKSKDAVQAAELAMSSRGEWPLPNVYLGVSVESQDYIYRLSELFSCQAKLYFLSAEPLLGPIDATKIPCPECRFMSGSNGHHVQSDCTICGGEVKGSDGYLNAFEEGLGWVIVGCESGYGARPMDLDWVRSLRDQCDMYSTPFFFKQAKDDHGHKITRPELNGKV